MPRREPVITRFGATDMQVCVPKDWTDEEVEDYAEKNNASGTGGWIIRKEGDEALKGDLEREPCTATLRPNFVHITLDAQENVTMVYSIEEWEYRIRNQEMDAEIRLQFLEKIVKDIIRGEYEKGIDK